MVEYLIIKVHVTSSRNHKTVSAEFFHKFLNHSATIFFKERETHLCFAECGMLAAYAWNASPINDTKIVRSVPVIGRELQFPLDINITKNPEITNNASQSVAVYLRRIQQDVDFSRQLLGWLLED